MSRKQHPVYGDPQRFEVVADFIAERYSNTIHCIADVAGGKGILTRILTKKKISHANSLIRVVRYSKALSTVLSSLNLRWRITMIC